MAHQDGKGNGYGIIRAFNQVGDRVANGFGRGLTAIEGVIGCPRIELEDARPAIVDPWLHRLCEQWITRNDSAKDNSGRKWFGKPFGFNDLNGRSEVIQQLDVKVGQCCGRFEQYRDRAGGIGEEDRIDEAYRGVCIGDIEDADVIRFRAGRKATDREEAWICRRRDTKTTESISLKARIAEVSQLHHVEVLLIDPPGENDRRPAWYLMPEREGLHGANGQGGQVEVVVGTMLDLPLPRPLVQNDPIEADIGEVIGIDVWPIGAPVKLDLHGNEGVGQNIIDGKIVAAAQEERKAARWKAKREPTGMLFIAGS